MFDHIDLNDEAFDICDFVPLRPTVNYNIDNMEWQRSALRAHSLRALYEAKCRDLVIEEDAS